MKCNECRYLIQSAMDELETQKCWKRKCYPDPFIDRECPSYKPADRLQQLRRMRSEKITDLLIYPVEKHGNTFYLTRDGILYDDYNKAFENTGRWLMEAPDKNGFY